MRVTQYSRNRSDEQRSGGVPDTRVRGYDDCLMASAQRLHIRHMRSIHTFSHHLAQRGKIRLAGRGAAEHKADRATGLGIFQPQEFHPVIAAFDVGGDLRNQRDAVAADDHFASPS